MSWRTAEAPRVWRLKESRLRLEGQVCPHCGGKMLTKRPVCRYCGEQVNLKPEKIEINPELSHAIISHLS